MKLAIKNKTMESLLKHVDYDIVLEGDPNEIITVVKALNIFQDLTIDIEDKQ